MVKAAADPPVTATDMRLALHKRWPAGDHVVIEEAPDDPMRMGRKLDMVAIHCWKSRGYELDGVEIKVSMGDWMREVNNPKKADWWWRHVHRFWLAVPAALAPKVRETLPETWGLLAVADGVSKVVKQAAKHEAEPFAWPHVVGLLRAATGTGIAALARAQQNGLQEGLKRAEAAQAQHGLPLEDPRLRREHEDLVRRVEEFEAATGIKVGAGYHWETQRLGVAVNVARKALADPDGMLRGLTMNGQALASRAAEVGKLVDDLAALFAQPELG